MLFLFLLSQPHSFVPIYSKLNYIEWPDSNMLKDSLYVFDVFFHWNYFICQIEKFVSNQTHLFGGALLRWEAVCCIVDVVLQGVKCFFLVTVATILVANR